MTERKMFYGLLIVSVAIAISRFVVPVSGELHTEDIYKDLTHIWVGILIGVSLMRPTYWWLPAGLTVVEVVAFILRSRP